MSIADVDEFVERWMKTAYDAMQGLMSARDSLLAALPRRTPRINHHALHRDCRRGLSRAAGKPRRVLCVVQHASRPPCRRPARAPENTEQVFHVFHWFTSRTSNRRIPIPDIGATRRRSRAPDRAAARAAPGKYAAMALTVSIADTCACQRARDRAVRCRTAWLSRLVPRGTPARFRQAARSLPATSSRASRAARGEPGCAPSAIRIPNSLVAPPSTTPSWRRPRSPRGKGRVRAHAQKHQQEPAIRRDPSPRDPPL